MVAMDESNLSFTELFSEYISTMKQFVKYGISQLKQFLTIKNLVQLEVVREGC